MAKAEPDVQERITLTVAVDRDVHDAIQDIANGAERTLAGQVRLILRMWFENRKLAGKEQ